MENSLGLICIDNTKNYECKNLSYKLIEGLDFQNSPVKSSFYRSDFRGTTFESDIFVQNNFDLADFISNIFRNVEFYRVNFGNSEFKNCFLRNCVFNNNTYNDIAVHSCTFSGCTFREECFKLTMLNCKFIRCNFINCTFDQCSTDTLVFEDCVFLKCELSTMHAENFKFERCTFRDVFLGTCFLGTYLFKDTDLNLISFKYRGEIVDTTSIEFFESFKTDLLSEKRFFEFFNLSILFHSGPLEEIAHRFPQMIADILKEPNPNVRKYNLSGIFDVIEFYLGSDKLPLFYALSFLTSLQEYPVSHIPEQDRLCYLQLLYRTETLFSSLGYSTEYIKSLSETIKCVATIHCNDNSVSAAENFINSLLEYVNQKYLDCLFEAPYFKTVSYEKGSVILTIASSLMLLLMAAKVVNTVSASICQIRIEAAKTKKAIELISLSHSPEAFEKAVSVLPQKETEKESAEKIFGQLGNSYLMDFMIHYSLK